ncbi:MAG: response regulator [Oscillatoria sp. PMC 1051.18]|nr:response regulator [Oscillatoria sp. PMC 1050.18]MEC5028910.1 response regulator [Oscillatoria sp. PMC 1051.18]
MRILLVEDDEILAQSLNTALSEQNYVVDIARDGEEGWEYAQAFTYDLILLDVSLPKLNGIALCRRLRKENYHSPILLLTARDASEDKVAGLDAGADDYVVKPCTIAELFARLRALLRRRSASGAPMLEWGELRLDPSSCEVTYQGTAVNVSPTEYGLLELLMRNPKRVFTKSAILEHLWSFEDPPNEDTVRAHIKGLRRKLKKANAGDAIETVYGVGYRLKPLSEGEVSKQDRTLRAVAEAWKKFKEPILARVETIAAASSALASGSLSEQLRQKAEQEAHKLAGSLGMFGFSEGSHLAREIETWLIELEAKNSGLGNLDSSDRATKPISLLGTDLQIEDLQALIMRLRQEIEQPAPTTSDPQQTIVIAEDLPDAPLVLLVDDDRALNNQLQQEALNWNLRLEVVETIEQAKAYLARKVPNLVILDLIFPPNPHEGLLLLEELTQQYSELPVLVFTMRDDFHDRVAVARLGGKAFLAKPVAATQVLEAAVDLLQNKRTKEATILAVDDDPIILQTLKQILTPWGIELCTVQNPLKFWEIFEKTSPDLLILDVDMPDIDGLELCQVVRGDRTWHGIPILFLSAHRSREVINQIYEAGADDYIAKPIVEPELVARIFNRLERTRLLRSLAETDALTGVANRYRSTRELNRYFRLAQRYQQPISLALLDLDNFKNVNDRYGYATGDRVLQRIGQILRLNFKSEDIVARWYGQQFVIGMYGLNQLEAKQRLEEILELIHQEIFLVAGKEPLQVTLSIGVAEYPQHGIELDKLYRAADAALVRAKHFGSSGIVLYSF